MFSLLVYTPIQNRNQDHQAEVSVRKIFYLIFVGERKYKSIMTMFLCVHENNIYTVILVVLIAGHVKIKYPDFSCVQLK